MKQKQLINTISEFWKVYNKQPNYRVAIKSASGCLGWFFDSGDDAQELYDSLGAQLGDDETIAMIQFTDDGSKILFEGTNEDNYPETQIPKRAEVEGMPKDAINNILYTLNYKGFELVFFVDRNSVDSEYNFNCYYNGKYIDYVGYPDYVTYNKHDLIGYINYMKESIATKLFNFEDLETISNYNDYENKNSFIINILPQMFDSLSAYNDNFKDLKDLYPYVGSSWSCYFKNKEDAQLTIKLDKKLNVLFNKVIINNKRNLYKAIVHEMFNHETPYEEDWESALNALGLSEKTLTPEQKQIAARAYSYVLRKCNW
jgi:hypothetical protein